MTSTQAQHSPSAQLPLITTATGTLADPKLVARRAQPGASQLLQEAGVSALVADLFAKRGVTEASEVLAGLEELIPPEELKNCLEMADILVGCRESGSRVLIISDYDCDGATACSVLLEAFHESGMNSGYLVPNREIHGYGLTPEIVNEAAALIPRPEYIITVDAGISSNVGVLRANELGIKVLITDHHLAPAVLPEAILIVNPNQPGDLFGSKHIAGCGVAWYVATAYYEALVAKGITPGFEPEQLLPYVALGTVADVVSLDKNNRILVAEGLRLIRVGQCSPGIKALAVVGKRKIELERMTTKDFGFALGPRVNAAGRLDWMNTGIECLTTKNVEQAEKLAKVLDETNEMRKAIQETMVIEAERLKDPEVMTGGTFSVAVFNPDFHKGVVGIVAGRMKEAYYRPTFVLTQSKGGEYVGSGRSIPGFHLKHALDEIHIAHPGLLPKFGGHAMAAGVTIARNRLEEFTTAFEAVCKAHLTPDLLEIKLEHDGAYPAANMNARDIYDLNSQVWGQGFPYPVFVDEITIKECKLLSEGKHMKMSGTLGAKKVDLIAFSQGHRYEDLEETITIAHQPDVNAFAGRETLQLQVSLFPGLVKVTPELIAARAADAEKVAAEKESLRRAKAIREGAAAVLRVDAHAKAALEASSGPVKAGGLLDRLRRSKEAVSVPVNEETKSAALAIAPIQTACPTVVVGPDKVLAPQATASKALGLQARLHGLRPVREPQVEVIAEAAEVEEVQRPRMRQ